MMSEVGLIASDTGAPGGRQVGQKVLRYVETGGAFEIACAGLLSSGFDTLLWTSPAMTTPELKRPSPRRGILVFAASQKHEPSPARNSSAVTVMRK